MLHFLFKPPSHVDAQLLAPEGRHDDAQLLAFEARLDARFNQIVLVAALVVALLAALMVFLFWKMDARLGKVEKNQTWMMLTLPERVDFWNARTANDPAPTLRPQNLAKDVAKHYHYGDNEAGGDLKLRCALTGELGETKVSKHPNVIVAHLLRRNNPDFAFAHFGLDAKNDRDGMRNVMPLCRGLEDAFDSKRISFYRTADRKIRMKVWDENVRKKQIYKGEKGDGIKTIGDFEGEFLKFPDDEKTPYTRILSYHHRVCFHNAKMRGWIDQNEVVPAVSGTRYKDTVPREIEIYTERDSHCCDQLSPSNHSDDVSLVTSSLTGDSTDATPTPS